MISCATGNPAASEDSLRNLGHHFGDRIPVYIAHAHAYCSNIDDAFAWLHAGIEIRDSALAPSAYGNHFLRICVRTSDGMIF